MSRLGPPGTLGAPQGVRGLGRGCGVVLALLGLASASFAAEVREERYSVMVLNETAGYLTASLRRNDIEVVYHVDENWRGAKTRATLRLDQDALPVDWHIRGNAWYGAPVEERFARRRDRAHWQTTNDAGEARGEAGRLYVANDASPWSLGLYARALLNAPNRALSVWPAGTMRIEEVRRLPIGTVAPLELTAYALWGMDLSPSYVLLDADRTLYAAILTNFPAGGLFVVRAGHETQFLRLSQLARALDEEYLARFAREQRRLSAPGERAASLDLASPRVRSMLDLLSERGATLDTTAAVIESTLLSRAGAVAPSDAGFLAHMPAPYQRARKVATLDVRPDLDATYRASFQRMLELIGQVHARGIRIVPGSDDVPGFTVHRELELYVAAGISPARALQIATLECARYLGTDQHSGSIEPGKIADLMLVDGDPTREIGAIRRIRLVVKEGDLYFPEDIHRAIGIEPFAHRAWYRAPAMNLRSTP